MGSPSILNQGLFRIADAGSPTAFNGAINSELYNQLRNSLFRGEATQQEPIKIEQRSGKPPKDFEWISLGPVIHDRIADLWSLSGVSGWSTYPVEICDVEGKQLPG